MPGDPFYKTQEWKELRSAVLKRDKHRCTIPGCPSTNRLTVDHIVSRRKGGSDKLSNLRTLCAEHDSALKEDATGARRSNGKATVSGCDASGQPIDPRHPWATPRD